MEPLAPPSQQFRYRLEQENAPSADPFAPAKMYAPLEARATGAPVSTEERPEFIGGEIGPYGTQFENPPPGFVVEQMVDADALTADRALPQPQPGPSRRKPPVDILQQVAREVQNYRPDDAWWNKLAAARVFFRGLNSLAGVTARPFFQLANYLTRELGIPHEDLEEAARDWSDLIGRPESKAEAVAGVGAELGGILLGTVTGGVFPRAGIRAGEAAVKGIGRGAAALGSRVPGATQAVRLIAGVPGAGLAGRVATGAGKAAGGIAGFGAALEAPRSLSEREGLADVATGTLEGTAEFFIQIGKTPWNVKDIIAEWSNDTPEQLQERLRTLEPPILMGLLMAHSAWQSRQAKRARERGYWQRKPKKRAGEPVPTPEEVRTMDYAEFYERYKRNNNGPQAQKWADLFKLKFKDKGFRHWVNAPSARAVAEMIPEAREHARRKATEPEMIPLGQRLPGRVGMIPLGQRRLPGRVGPRRPRVRQAAPSEGARRAPVSRPARVDVSRRGADVKRRENPTEKVLGEIDRADTVEQLDSIRDRVHKSGLTDDEKFPILQELRIKRLEMRAEEPKKAPAPKPPPEEPPPPVAAKPKPKPKPPAPVTTPKVTQPEAPTAPQKPAARQKGTKTPKKPVQKRGGAVAKPEKALAAPPRVRKITEAPVDTITEQFFKRVTPAGLAKKDWRTARAQAQKFAAAALTKRGQVEGPGIKLGADIESQVVNRVLKQVYGKTEAQLEAAHAKGIARLKIGDKVTAEGWGDYATEITAIDPKHRMGATIQIARDPFTKKPAWHTPANLRIPEKMPLSEADERATLANNITARLPTRKLSQPVEEAALEALGADTIQESTAKLREAPVETLREIDKAVRQSVAAADDTAKQRRIANDLLKRTVHSTQRTSRAETLKAAQRLKKAEKAKLTAGKHDRPQGRPEIVATESAGRHVYEYRIQRVTPERGEKGPIYKPFARVSGGETWEDALVGRGKTYDEALGKIAADIAKRGSQKRWKIADPVLRSSLIKELQKKRRGKAVVRTERKASRAESALEEERLKQFRERLPALVKKLPKGRKETIEIKSWSGKRKVEATRHGEHFAIHKSLAFKPTAANPSPAKIPADRKWSVTHLPTGMATAKTRTRVQAMEALALQLEAWPGPWDFTSPQKMPKKLGETLLPIMEALSRREAPASFKAEGAEIDRLKKIEEKARSDFKKAVDDASNTLGSGPIPPHIGRVIVAGAKLAAIRMIRTGARLGKAVEWALGQIGHTVASLPSNAVGQIYRAARRLYRTYQSTKDRVKARQRMDAEGRRMDREARRQEKADGEFDIGMSRASERRFYDRLKARLRKYVRLKEPPRVMEAEKPAPKAMRERVARAIEEAKPLRGMMEYLKHEELRRRARRVSETFERYEGVESLRRAQTQMKGELPAIGFEPIADKIPPDMQHAILEHIRTHAALRGKPFDKMRLMAVMDAIFNQGHLPTQGELGAIEQILGPRIALALLGKFAVKDKLYLVVSEAFNLPRSMGASYDLSATLRQTYLLTVSHPGLALRGIGRQIRAFASEQYATDFDEMMRASPEFEFMRDVMNVDFTKPGALSTEAAKLEESWFTHLPYMVSQLELKSWAKGLTPVQYFFKGIRGSERAFVTYSNWMRSQVGNGMIELLRAAGHSPNEALLQMKRFSEARAAQGGKLGALERRKLLKSLRTLKFYRQAGSYLNMMSGRATIGGGKLGLQQGVMNWLFFSTRLWASAFAATVYRVPTGLFSRNPAVRAETWRGVLATAAILGSFYVLAETLLKSQGVDAKVELNPESTDFGRFKIGTRTVLSITGTFGQAVAFLTQTLTAHERDLYTGRRKRKNPLQGTLRFLLGRLAPTPGAVRDHLRGRTFKGEVPTAWTTLRDLMSPIILQTAMEVTREHGAKGLILMIPETPGMSVNVRELDTDEQIRQLDKFVQRMAWWGTDRDEMQRRYSAKLGNMRSQWYDQLWASWLNDDEEGMNEAVAALVKLGATLSGAKSSASGRNLEEPAGFKISKPLRKFPLGRSAKAPPKNVDDFMAWMQESRQK